MINMMYLVLTALLALNVSKETLDVIAKVNTGLIQTNENFASKNELTYAAFDKAYLVNPTKVEDWKIKADLLKARSQSVIDLINKFKWDIVRESDGEDAHVDNINNKDDLNTPAYIMLEVNYENSNKKRGEILRDSLHGFEKFLNTLVDPSDTVLVNTIENSFDVSDIPATPDEPSRTWQQDNFEYLPLIGVITLMTKMQSDVRNAESDVLNYLYKGIDEESFTFNKLKATIVPGSNKVVQGYPYEAQIFLTAVDTTQDPIITVNGQEIPVTDGMGTYIFPSPSLGNHTLKGLIRYKGPDGRILPYRFESDYEVLPATLIVSPTKMNVFYHGLDNPVEISAVGAAPENTTITVSNATYERVKGYTYNIKPTQNYGESIIKVSAVINGKKQTYPDKRFRLKRVPDPVARVANLPGGNIQKALLSQQVGVEAFLEDFLFDYQYEVQRFTVSSTVNRYTHDEPSSSYKFTQKQRDLINQVPRGKRVFIENIFALGPDGEERKVPSIIFIMQ